MIDKLTMKQTGSKQLPSFPYEYVPNSNFKYIHAVPSHYPSSISQKRVTALIKTLQWVDYSFFWSKCPH